MAASTETASEGVVVVLTVGEPLVFVEASPVKWLLALLADKAVRTPLHVQGRDVVVHDGLGAATALGGELAIVALLAVCSILPLMETIISQLNIIDLSILFSLASNPNIMTYLFPTREAKEALRVPCLVQSRDTLVQDGSPAPRTPGAEDLLIALLTVWLPISFKKVLGSQLLKIEYEKSLKTDVPYLVALAAAEVLWMPCPAQCSDHLDNFMIQSYP